MPLGLSMFHGQHGTQWNYMMAASAISMLPSTLLVVLLQRHLVQGIAMSGFGGRSSARPPSGGAECRCPFASRQVHLEFRTGPAIPDVGRDFDPDRFAQTMADKEVRPLESGAGHPSRRKAR